MASDTLFIAGKSMWTERSFGKIRSRKNFNITVSPAFASSIPLRTSSNFIALQQGFGHQRRSVSRARSSAAIAFFERATASL